MTIDDTQPAPRPLGWGAATDTGRVRTENEDNFVAESMVFGVADGMGGHQAGEVASNVAATVLRDRLAGGATRVDVVIAAVVEANAAIFQAAHANTDHRGMGTTLTALVVLHGDGADDRFALINVGDSRTYVVRHGTLRRVTVDHSYVQELVATGHITEAEARTHPRRNIVTRALGIEPHVRVDSWVLPMVRGDRFLLCSDGLVDEVPDEEIVEIAAGYPDPQAAAEALVAAANAHGGHDNVTVVVVDVLEGMDLPAGDEPPAASPGWDGDDDGIGYGPVDAESGSDDALRLDDTAELAMPAHAASAPAPRRRRLTPGAFLFGLAVAAIVVVTVTLVAVVVSNRDEDAPPATTTTVRSTTTTTDADTSTTGG